MTIQEFLKISFDRDQKFFIPRPRILCKDGFSMSVQGGDGIYSTPRENSMFFFNVEVGYPSKKEKSLMPHIGGNKGCPKDTIYGYVPIETVDDIVKKHGGIVGVAMSIKRYAELKKSKGE